MTDAIKHSTKSPSKFERIRLCPGSVREEAKYPDERSGAAAADGTHSHTLLEYCLIDNSEPQVYLGKSITDQDGEFIVDQERINRVKVAVDYLRKRQIEIGALKIDAERWLDSRNAFGRDDMSGTCDASMWGSDGTLECVDYKDGMGPVDLPCDQLDIYTAMLLFNTTPTHKVTKIRQTIIQPKLSYRGENGVTYVDRDIKEFIPMVEVYKAAAEAADKPDAPLVAGEKQCKYCKHKPCEERNKVAMAAMGFLPVVTASPIPMDIASQSAAKDPATMTGEQLKGIIEAAPLIRQLIEAAEAEAQRRLEAGQQIDGIKLVRGRGSRSWAYGEDEMAEKLLKMKIPKDVVWKTTLVSPAQAEKLVWTKTKRDGTSTTHQLTEKQLKILTDEYTKKSEGKVQVAAASDSRPAVVLSVTNMFAPVALEVVEIPAFLQIPDFMK